MQGAATVNIYNFFIYTYNKYSYCMYKPLRSLLSVVITSGSRLKRYSPLRTEQATDTRLHTASNSPFALRTMKFAGLPASIP